MDKPSLREKVDSCKLKPVNKLKFRVMVGVANTLFKRSWASASTMRTI